MSSNNGFAFHPKGTSSNGHHGRNAHTPNSNQTPQGRGSKKQKWETSNWRASSTARLNTNNEQSGGPSAHPGNGVAVMHSKNHSNMRSAKADSPGITPVNQVQDISSGMENISLAAAENHNISQPLTEFHRFPDLPTELRLKIWKFVDSVPRILEVQYDVGIAEVNDCHGAHNYYHMTPKSSVVPALFHVCSESREEGMRRYQPYDFTDNYRGKPSMLTYFDPSLDTIYFGEGTCMETIVHFIHNCNRKDYKIPRVAILCSGQITNCHDWDKDDMLHGPDQYACDLWQAIAGGCTLMQALHGIDEAIAWNSLAPGCKGLKEVFWVVKSQLMPSKVGEINDKVTLRPAVGDGLTKGQKTLKSKIEDDIERVECGLGLEHVGYNKWFGPEKPSFQFVHLAPTPEKGKKYDSLIIQAKDLYKLSYRGYEYIKQVEKWSDCMLQVCEKEYPTQKEIEVGFYGTEEGIAYAKGKIDDKLRSRVGNNRRRN